MIQAGLILQRLQG